jgi:hypothetical protein
MAECDGDEPDELIEELALQSLKDLTGWEHWFLAGKDCGGDVYSYTFMRIPYIFGAYFVVEVSRRDNSVRTFPGK